MDPQGAIVGGFALAYGVFVLRQAAKRRRDAEPLADPTRAPSRTQQRALYIKGAILIALALVILATAILRHP